MRPVEEYWAKWLRENGEQAGLLSRSDFTRLAFHGAWCAAHMRMGEKREELLRMCHTAPKAVDMDTRDLESAIRRLVEFAWESVQ